LGISIFKIPHENSLIGRLVRRMADNMNPDCCQRNPAFLTDA